MPCCSGDARADATGSETVRNDSMGEEGLEPSHDSPGKTPNSDSGGAECGALGVDRAPGTAAPDPDLEVIVAAWPTLPPPIRTAILALLDSTQPEGRE